MLDGMDGKDVVILSQRGLGVWMDGGWAGRQSTSSPLGSPAGHKSRLEHLKTRTWEGVSVTAELNPANKLLTSC
jgi:hypothetical protein